MNGKSIWRARRLVPVAAGVVLAVGGGFANPVGARSPGSAWVRHDTLNVRGTSGGDEIALRLAAGDPDRLEVDFGADGSAERTFDRDTFSEIAVLARSGDDLVEIDGSNGAFTDEAITIHGGSGGDTLLGGDGAERFVAGSGSDAVRGGRGADEVDLGSGSDSFRWDPGDGSDVIDGRSGTDTLDFNGAGVSEDLRLAPNGEQAVFTRNVGNVRMGTTNVERLDLDALGGADTVTVDDMSGTDMERADVNLALPGPAGDGAADTVTVNGTDGPDDIDVHTADGAVEVDGLAARTVIAGSEPSDLLQISARGGDDDVDVDDDVTGLIGVAVDLGTDG